MFSSSQRTRPEKSAKRRSAEGAALTITVEQQILWFSPETHPLARIFTFTEHRAKLMPDSALALTREPQSLLPKATDGATVMVNRGLLLPISIAAELCGYPFQVRAYPSGNAVQRSMACDPEITGELAHVLDLMEFSTHGLIRHDLSVSGLARLIVCIAAAFPEATLAFVCARFDLLRRLYQQLPAELQRETTLADADNVPDQPRRLLLGTPYALAPCTNWDDRRQISVLLDAAEITHEQMQMALLWQHTRLFGLIRLGAKLPPKTRDLMFAAFGPQEATLPALGRRCRRVETVLCRPIGTFSRTPYEPWQLSRSQIQQHGLRNEMLSIVAHGVAKGNNIDDRLERPLSAAWRRPLRTLVLSETVEHAAAIGRNMAPWPIVVGDDAYLDGLPDPNRYQTVDRFLAGDAKNLIATTAAAARLDWERFDAVVWAGGGFDGPLPPFGKLTCPASSDHRLLLVDVHDRHHVELRRQTAKRRHNYDARDWFPLGADDVACRCRRYWREREVTP